MSLLLLPNLLGGSADDLSPAVHAAVAQIDGLIAESEREGRRFLSHFKLTQPLRRVPLALISRKPDRQELSFLLEPLEAGERWGFVSDAGMPCLADPGAALVALARRRGLGVRAFAGPSALVLALVLSGLPAQRFAFTGYLPRNDAGAALLRMERRSREERATQGFMEPPYRNDQTFRLALETLDAETLLCVACDLTRPSEQLVTAPVKRWTERPILHKRPTIFLLYAR